MLARRRRPTGEELLLNSDSLRDDLTDDLRVGAPLQVAEEQACEVGVHALVTRDELVGEREAGHETTLLQPEDGRKGAREKDTLDGGEGN